MIKFVLGKSVSVNTYPVPEEAFAVVEEGID